MFSSVSWQQFITVLIILLFVYYFLVVVIYYRKDLVQLYRQGFHKKENPVIIPKADPVTQQDTNTILFSTVHELMEEIKGVFNTASKNDYPKEELLLALQLKLRNYSVLKGTTFQVSVNSHIAQEAKEQCETVLTLQELQNIW